LPLQAQGEFALVKEKLEMALDLPGQPVKRGTMAHQHIIYMMLADSAGQLRDAAALPRYAARLEELARRDGHQPYLAVAQRAWGIAHRLNKEYAQAQARLTEALDHFEERGARWQTGRTLLEMAELALAQADATAAHDHFSRALAEFEALGARPDAERTRTALQELN
jgi:tetratricopeptide (TPR) repeat protein